MRCRGRRACRFSPGLGPAPSASLPGLLPTPGTREREPPRPSPTLSDLDSPGPGRPLNATLLSAATEPPRESNRTPCPARRTPTSSARDPRVDPGSGMSGARCRARAAPTPRPPDNAPPAPTPVGISPAETPITCEATAVVSCVPGTCRPACNKAERAAANSARRRANSPSRSCPVGSGSPLRSSILPPRARTLSRAAELRPGIGVGAAPFSGAAADPSKSRAW